MLATAVQGVRRGLSDQSFYHKRTFQESAAGAASVQIVCVPPSGVVQIR